MFYQIYKIFLTTMARVYFIAPYCDRWELRDKSLVVIIGEQVQSFHFIQTIYNWSKDLIVCTNGKPFQNSAQKALVQNKGIRIMALQQEFPLSRNY
jgi:hypothetical protein